MQAITRTARFGPEEAVTRILEELACPCCGHVDPDRGYRLSTDRRLRIFCDSCGAFLVVSLNSEQAATVLRRFPSCKSPAPAPASVTRR
jgi:hypothetical protein